MSETSVDDDRVRQFIVWAEHRSYGWVDKNRADLLAGDQNGALIPEVKRYAIWQLLMEQRRKPLYDGDYDLAAAEWYSYIKFVTASSGDNAAHVAVTAYYYLKRAVPNIVRQKLRTDKNHPVLNANKGVRRWGHQGVADGVEIWKQDHPGEQLRTGASARSTAPFVLEKAGLSDATAQKIGRGIGDYLQSHPAATTSAGDYGRR
ncbi:hypothetical protein [Methylosinus sp. LW4]|uniref:hypothetical protein n=1 Tax=Methylosinus sp. LW4 TaxID=136993 RepID=UPI0012F74695|nr:hypothetical protein [Methylosinus sp. LW4]